jgi:hypothetical protein
MTKEIGRPKKEIACSQPSGRGVPKMIIQSKSIEMVDVSKIVPNPKNPNKHPKEQIERLSRLIDFQGFRQPLIISNRSGFLVAGHGRLEMALYKGITELPVMYQDFESEAQEYAFVVSDNEIQRWAETDRSMVQLEMLDLDIDTDLFAIKDFAFVQMETLDYSDKNSEIDTDNFGNDLEHTCPKCGFEFNE